MSTGSSFSDEGSRPPPPVASGSHATPETRSEHNLLDAVLQQTLSAALGTVEFPQSLDSLRDVARRLGNQHFSKDPILVEMVRSILSPQWPETSNQRWSSDVVSHRVADVLFDDPVSRDRLENLWNQLCQQKP